jgi:hypothetical protein
MVIFKLWVPDGNFAFEIFIPSLLTYGSTLSVISMLKNFRYSTFKVERSISARPFVIKFSSIFTGGA